MWTEIGVVGRTLTASPKGKKKDFINLIMC